MASVYINTHMKTFICVYCNKENQWLRSSKNKFCDNACQAKYQWVTDTVPRIERGECTSNSSKTLKKYLIEKHGARCSKCSISDIWNDLPLVLQLDHEDGDSDNNHVDNIRLLCPNCHSQTPTFCSRGKGNRYKKSSKRNRYLQQYKTVP